MTGHVRWEHLSPVATDAPGQLEQNYNSRRITAFCRVTISNALIQYQNVLINSYLQNMCCPVSLTIQRLLLLLYTNKWTDHVRNEEVLLRVNEQRNTLHEIRKRKTNWIGHILRRNCLLQQVIEGKIKGQIEATRRRGRSRKKLLDDLKDRRGYCQLKEEAVDRTMRRNRFGRGFGPVV